MNLPQGYKQTELGIIPEDWEVTTLGSLGSIVGGGTPSTSNHSFWDGDIQWFTPAEIGENKYVAKSKRTISNYGLKYSSANILPQGAILLTTRATIGDSAILLNKATTNQGFHSIIVNTEYYNEYVYYILKTKVSDMLLLASGSTFAEISKTKLSIIKIVKPPIAEQKAIAEALSDVDDLITALDKKIAKKRLIKQGAMQELLTGKKRLPGFEEEWEEKRLGDISDIYQPQTISQEDFTIDGYNVYGANGVIGKYKFYNHTTIQVMITCRGSSCGAVNMSNGYCWITGNAMVINMDKYKINKAYVYYYLLNQDLSELITGSGQPQIVRTPLREFTIKIPKILDEQQAIATILSDMDKEIAELEAQRDKYRLVKSGMMQKLLTGEIRLKKPQASQILESKAIPVDAHIIAGHIVNRLYKSEGWGRTKLQKSLHLAGYYAQIYIGNEYIRNTAGPDDQRLMNYIDQQFRQFNHVKITRVKLNNGKIHYNYTPTSLIQEVEMAYEKYPENVRKQIDLLIDKMNVMDLDCAEILSTLYGVWNNRIIKSERITDDLLIADFYAWSKHKLEFDESRLRKALVYMREENIVPIGWGKYIDKKN